MSGNQCQCGQPIQGTANLCRDDTGLLRRNLYTIADRWPDLEAALSHAEKVESEGKPPKRSTSTGLRLNDLAIAARRACTDAVWFVAQVLREDFDEQGWTFAPPIKVTSGHDGTPTLARWLASAHVEGIAGTGRYRMARETAEEVWTDIATAERATWDAIKEQPRQIDTGMPCEAHGTSELGERMPCDGRMRARLTDSMPDLVCSVDSSHRISPDVWSRYGWRIAHEGAARNLIKKIAG
ncbi:MAG: hypothetical protein ABR616_17015 [Dermatophilaceae bacterium]